MGYHSEDLPDFLRAGEGAVSLTPPARTRKELEALIGVGSVEEAHAKRRALWQQHAPLYARVQTWDARRKRLKSLILVELHNSYIAGTRRGQKKPAVDVLEAMAYTDERYTKFIEQAEEDIGQWALIETELRAIDEVINRDQRLIGFATAEVRV